MPRPTPAGSFDPRWTVARSIAGYRAQLGDTSAAVLRLVSRDLDRRVIARKPMSTAAE